MEKVRCHYCRRWTTGKTYYNTPCCDMHFRIYTEQSKAIDEIKRQAAQRDKDSELYPVIEGVHFRFAFGQGDAARALPDPSKGPYRFKNCTFQGVKRVLNKQYKNSLIDWEDPEKKGPIWQFAYFII